MPFNAISDYNGAIIENKDEGKLWRYVGFDSLSFTHPIRFAELLKPLPKLLSLMKRYYSGEIGYDKVYEVLNEGVLSQLSLSSVKSSIDKYAANKKTQRRLDHSLLRAIDSAHKEGAKTGILSAGCGYGIERTLQAAGYYNSFDRIVANDAVQKDYGSEFQLRIYGNKADFLERIFFRELGFDPKLTVYIGDNIDEESCMDYMIAEGGRILIPLFASDYFKEYFADRYKDKAIIPEKAEDVPKVLGL